MEGSRKRKAPDDSPDKSKGNRRQSPRAIPERKQAKRPHLDSSGSCKSPNRRKSDTSSTTRSCNLSASSSFNTTEGNSKQNARSRNNVNTESESSGKNDSSKTSFNINSLKSKVCRNDEVRSTPTSHETQKSGCTTRDSPKPSCSYKTSSSKRGATTYLSLDNTTSSSALTSYSASSNGDNITGSTSSSSGSSSFSSGSCTSSSNSNIEKSGNNTDSNNTQNGVNTRSSSSSSSKRELKNLQDAWSVSVSPFRTRSQREGGTTTVQKTRRHINFTSDTSSSSCCPPSSPSTAKSTSSELLSTSEMETSDIRSVPLNTDKKRAKEYRLEHNNLQQTSQESKNKLLESPDSVTSVSSKASLTSKTKSEVGSPSATTSVNCPVVTNIPEASDRGSTYTTSSTNELNNTTDTCSGTDKSDISLVNNVGDLPVFDEQEKLSSAISSSSRFSSESEGNPLSLFIRKPTKTDKININKNRPTDPVSTRQLRSRRLSGGVQATTSKAASCDGIYSDTCIKTHSSTGEDNSLPSKLHFLETTKGTMSSNVSARMTRSRSASGDKHRSAAFKHKTSHGDGNSTDKPRLTKLMTILTSEHDYFKKETTQLTSDLQVFTCRTTNKHAPDVDTDKTYTIYAAESSLDTKTDHEQGNPNIKVNMDRSDNALSGMPSEDILYSSPMPGSAMNISNPAFSDDARSFAQLSSVHGNTGSSTSVCEEGRNLNFDLNDFVIRRRRLRSESTEDELWEGLPAVAPFRKQSSKFKSDGKVASENDDKDASQNHEKDAPQHDDSPDGNTYSPSSGHSLKQSSTTDLISEIDSILSDTQSSNQYPVSSSADNITQFFEETEEGLDMNHFGPQHTQQIIDKDINYNTEESLEFQKAIASSSDSKSMQNNAKFSSDPASPNSPFSPLNQESDMQHKSESDITSSPYQMASQVDGTPSDVSTTPLASRPESVWWSEMSEDWATTPEENPLEISTQDRSSTNVAGDSSQRCECDISDAYDYSCAAVDESVFKEITARNDTKTCSTQEGKNNNLNSLQEAEDSVTSSTEKKQALTSDDLTHIRTPSVTDESDGNSHFMVSESNMKDKQGDDPAKVKDGDGLTMSNTNPEPSLSESSTSSEFLLWNKKKDQRKISFPRIVLRKCKDTLRHNTSTKETSDKLQAPKENQRKMTNENRQSSRQKVKKSFSHGSSDDSPTPKRSARLMNRVDSTQSNQSSRSTDFVYTPLKRDDSKTKSSSQTATQAVASSPENNVKSNTDATVGDTRADFSSQVKNQTKRTKTDYDSSSGPVAGNSNPKSTQPKTRSEVLKKSRDGGSYDRGLSEIHQSPINIFRRRKGPVIDEELLTNPVIDKHACVLWSSEHRRHFQLTHPDATPSQLDEMLRNQWSHELTAHEKMKYFTRARDAVRDEDKHAQRSSRDGRRSGRSADEKKSKDDDMSTLEKFTRLKIKRQKDLLTKWLHFFQKVLSRKEYADFIEDVKQGILEAEARDKPNKTRGLTSKIFSHKKLLFIKMNNLKDHVMKQYCSRIYRQKELHKLAFDILVTRLIEGKPCAFIKGCRSRVLTAILQDLKELEYGDSVAVLGYPISTKSFTNLYKEIVETVDSCMFRDNQSEENSTENNTSTESSSVSSVPCDTNDEREFETSEQSQSCPLSSKESIGPSVQTSESAKSELSASRPCLANGPITIDCEWYDKPVNPIVMDKLLEEIRIQPGLPVLQHNALDTFFLPPPTRTPVSYNVRTMPAFPRPSVPVRMTPRLPFQSRYNCISRTPAPLVSSQDVQNVSGLSSSTRMQTRPLDPRIHVPQMPIRGISMLTNNYHSSSEGMSICYQPVRNVMFSEARDAFSRSYTGTTNSCCELDSPACVLSTLVVAEKTNLG